MANKYLEKIASGETINMGMDASRKLSQVLGVGHKPPAVMGQLAHYSPKTGMGLGRKLGIGAGVLGAGALAAGLLHRNKQEQAGQPTQVKSASEHWIQGVVKHKGALHAQLGIPEGEKIPQATLDAAAKKGGKLGERARLAETLERFKK